LSEQLEEQTVSLEAIIKLLVLFNLLSMVNTLNGNPFSSCKAVLVLLQMDSLAKNQGGRMTKIECKQIEKQRQKHTSPWTIHNGIREMPFLYLVSCFLFLKSQYFVHNITKEERRKSSLNIITLLLLLWRKLSFKLYTRIHILWWKGNFPLT